MAMKLKLHGIRNIPCCKAPPGLTGIFFCILCTCRVCDSVVEAELLDGYPKWYVHYELVLNMIEINNLRLHLMTSDGSVENMLCHQKVPGSMVIRIIAKRHVKFIILLQKKES